MELYLESTMHLLLLLQASDSPLLLQKMMHKMKLKLNCGSNENVLQILREVVSQGVERVVH